MKTNKPAAGKATAKTGKVTLEAVQQKNYLLVPPNQIIVDEKTNYRELYEDIEELSESIVQNGLRNPVKVYKKDNAFHLREGFRRMRAIQLALKKGQKIERIPVIVDERPLSQEERTLEFLINNDGKPYTMLEQADVIKDLLKFGLKITDIVRRTGKARGYIDNLVMLTNIPTKVREYILADRISAHAVIQILQAFKGDEAKLLEAVEEAMKAAKAAGKEKATPKHVATKKVKSQSFGKFYKWVESLADCLAGRKDTFSQRSEVVDKLMLSFENGKPAKQLLEEYFIDKSKKVPAPAVKVAPVKAVKKAANKTAKKKNKPLKHK